jgi:hypothetical protein
MKKVITLSILGFIICTAFITPQVLDSARTDKSIITDYRDAYTGTYLCRSNCIRMQFNNPNNLYTQDTVSIAISKDAIDSVMQLKIGNGQIVKLKLVHKRLSSYVRGGHYGGKFYASDSLDFTFAPLRVSSCSYAGKKK